MSLKIIATVVCDNEPLVTSAFKNIEIHQVKRLVSDNVPKVSKVYKMFATVVSDNVPSVYSVFKNVEIYQVRIVVFDNHQ